ncbi:ABC transporter permease [Vibrio mangrovi]|uniref:ABC transporter permease n=1 Tax=Vibrio mangrovi TaxID=474394 RepID=A0A1Y6IT17_9VIBR|nr:ABC transporter permease [Vibrio mangrovi]MDW6004480.1 ABC transporter permease [Vibrio mangrovi]SMS00768.1 Oligopeptide transport system permease protein OppC [Vibrio mangrovi]
MKQSQSYSSLVWVRFKRNKMALMSLILLAILGMTSVFAPFFSPNDPDHRFSSHIYDAPSSIHWIDQDGTFHFWPFVYAKTVDLDPVTFLPITKEDHSHPIYLEFFSQGWEYFFLGMSFDRHIVGLEDGSPIFLLGSDNLGRDLISRCFFGSRVTLLFAIAVVALVVSIGTVVGILSGYHGGRFDFVVQRIAELALAFPAVPLYLALIAVLPKTADSTSVFIMLIVILSSLQWAFIARQVRAQALSMRNLDYIRAAKSVGAKDMRIVLRHILPNVTSNIVVLATIMLPTIVLTESFFSFLSVGVKAPMFSWGSLLNSAGQFQTIGSYPWLLYPVGFILVTVLGFNALGDGLRDAVDPYSGR